MLSLHQLIEQIVRTVSFCVETKLAGSATTFNLLSSNEAGCRWCLAKSIRNDAAGPFHFPKHEQRAVTWSRPESAGGEDRMDCKAPQEGAQGISVSDRTKTFWLIELERACLHPTLVKQSQTWAWIFATEESLMSWSMIWVHPWLLVDNLIYSPARSRIGWSWVISSVSRLQIGRRGSNHWAAALRCHLRVQFELSTRARNCSIEKGFCFLCISSHKWSVLFLFISDASPFRVLQKLLGKYDKVSFFCDFSSVSGFRDNSNTHGGAFSYLMWLWISAFEKVLLSSETNLGTEIFTFLQYNHFCWSLGQFSGFQPKSTGSFGSWTACWFVQLCVGLCAHELPVGCENPKDTCRCVLIGQTVPRKGLEKFHSRWDFFFNQSGWTSTTLPALYCLPSRPGGSVQSLPGLSVRLCDWPRGGGQTNRWRWKQYRPKFVDFRAVKIEWLGLVGRVWKRRLSRRGLLADMANTIFRDDQRLEVFSVLSSLLTRCGSDTAQGRCQFCIGQTKNSISWVLMLSMYDMFTSDIG